MEGLFLLAHINICKTTVLCKRRKDATNCTFVRGILGKPGFAGDAENAGRK
jgi:hypothetical protein